MADGLTDGEAVVVLTAESLDKPFGKVRSRFLGRIGAAAAAKAKNEKNVTRLQVAAKSYRRLERLGISPIKIIDIVSELTIRAVTKKDPSLAISENRLRTFTLKQIKADADSLPY